MPSLRFDPMEPTVPQGVLQCDTSDIGAFHLRYLPPIPSDVRPIDSVRADNPTRHRICVSR